jgi:hypothetical protein
MNKENKINRRPRDKKAKQKENISSKATKKTKINEEPIEKKLEELNSRLLLVIESDETN